MEAVLVLAVPILFATAWLYTAQMSRMALPNFRNKRICLLIAHPDDEAMFFSPTLLALTAEESGNHVKILCFSSGLSKITHTSDNAFANTTAAPGNADGLGETRKQELQASAKSLGLRSQSDVLVLDDSRFPDSMTTTWPADKIAQVLAAAFSPPVSASSKKSSGSSSDAPSATIDLLLTFDSRGVSAHPNHVSLYHGARAWLSSLMAGKAGWKCPVELYTLTTTNILRKYVSFLDAPVAMIIGGLRGVGLSAKKKKREEPPSLLFVSDYGQLRRGQNAMVKGHKSQMRWFRWGWVGLGRYMVVNDLKRETVI